MEAKKYHPINCSFYDELEQVATLKAEVLLGYKNDLEEIEERKLVITNLQSKQGEEFLTASDGWQLRLDLIVHINGKYLSEGYCGY